MADELKSLDGVQQRYVEVPIAQHSDNKQTYALEVSVLGSTPTGSVPLATEQTLQDVLTAVGDVESAIQAQRSIADVMVIDSSVPPQYFVRKETYDPSTGTSTVAFYNLDGTVGTPVMPVMGISDRQQILQTWFQVKDGASGTGYSSGDLISNTQVINKSDGTTITQFWFNSTTGLPIAAPASGDLELQNENVGAILKDPSGSPLGITGGALDTNIKNKVGYVQSLVIDDDGELLWRSSWFENGIEIIKFTKQDNSIKNPALPFTPLEEIVKNYLDNVRGSIGYPSDATAADDTGNYAIISLFKRLLTSLTSRWSDFSARFPASLGQKTSDDSLPVVLPSDQTVSVDTGLDQPLTDTQLRASAVPISASSLPLPSGAATSAKQDTGNTYLESIDTKLTTNIGDGGVNVHVLNSVAGVTQDVNGQTITTAGSASSGSVLTGATSVGFSVVAGTATIAGVSFSQYNDVNLEAAHGNILGAINYTVDPNSQVKIVEVR